MIQPALQDDAFIADVRFATRDREHLHLWWLGQSGFLIQCNGQHSLLDPYLSDSLTAKYAKTNTPHVRMSQRVVAPAQLTFVDVVTSSHNHTDHLDAETLGPILAAKPLALVIPEANRRFVVDRLSLPETVPNGLTAGQSISFERLRDRSSRVVITAVPASHADLAALGYVLHLGQFSVYHSGDTVVYDGMVESLRPFNIDIAILPINGKLGNMNGREAAKLAHDIGAKIVIPCHYDMFEFNTADPHEQFVPECERLGQAYRVLKLGERFTFP